MNLVILKGNVGMDAEVKTIGSGKVVTSFTLCTNESYGNGESKATWHNIVMWGENSSKVAQYIKKGRSLLVNGRINNSEYKNANGDTVRRSEIIVNNVEFCDSTNQNNNGSQSEYKSQKSAPTQAAQQPTVQQRSQVKPTMEPVAPVVSTSTSAYFDSDDELPF